MNRENWNFAKQNTDFELCVKLANLISDANEKGKEYTEKYFNENRVKFGIPEKVNYRLIGTAQILGLITKTPFYASSKRNYCTSIYDLIKQHETDEVQYNIIKTEQLLKFRIRAIISEKKNKDFCILPVLFIYLVLKELKAKGRNYITNSELDKYVMTCKNLDEVNNAVFDIINDTPVSIDSKAVSDCRVDSLIIKNLKLFVTKGRGEKRRISINPDFDDYFNSEFVKNINFIDLNEKLLDENYADFLYNYQGFNINLIDKPAENKLVLSTKYERNSEIEYTNKVDLIHENEIDKAKLQNAHKIAPATHDKTKSKTSYNRDPKIGKSAIIQANYSCEISHEHKTFMSKATGKPYMESHHLVPIQFQSEMWGKYRINIDCVENLVSLCPTCHKAFHYGTDEVKSEIIEIMYAEVAHKYKAIGFEITLDEIKRCYGIGA